MIPYEIFSTLMQESGVHNQWEYQELYDKKIVPVDLVPRNPADVYVIRVAKLTYSQCKHRFQLEQGNQIEIKPNKKCRNQREFLVWCASNPGAGIVSHPDRLYKDKGWINWASFLDSGMCKYIYPSYDEIKKMVRKAKIKSHVEYTIWVKKARTKQYHFGIPSNPDSLPKYKKQWKNWGEFLGTGRIANQLMNDPPLRRK
jgi:hypothetical protein